MKSNQQFAATPPMDELKAFPREASFVPSPVTAPTTLTFDQVTHFNRAGYIAPIDVFSRAEALSCRTYFDELLKQVLAAGGDAYSISTAHLRYGPVYDLLCEPRIVNCVRDLLGDDVIGWGSHYFCKLPGDEQPVDWHQDASYWPLSPTRTVTVWLAIDDADLENGCMQFIEASHLQGELPHEADDDGTSSVLGRGIHKVARLGQVIDNPLRAGQISIHSDLLVHGSAPNRSSRRRCGLTLRYCTPDVRAGLDWHLKGVVVSGKDRSGHWANPSRPTGESP